MTRVIAVFDSFERARTYKSKAGYIFAYYEIVPWFFGLYAIELNIDKWHGMAIDSEIGDKLSET
jgi:hypothetical protein